MKTYQLTTAARNVGSLGPVSNPEYRVPLVSEIRDIATNGYKVASTFAGCGGSSTGYHMAGYDVIWANEFLPEACDSYRANWPDTIIDDRSIADIQPADFFVATGLSVGELDVFDGSPPCQPFSTAGVREKGWKRSRDYGNGKGPQHDVDLFWEYARLVEGIQPKVFIAENVSGLVKGKAKGYFKLILQRLKDCGYQVRAQVLDAQWLGVPQMRQRVIFIGTRLDLDIKPAFPQPLSYRYSVRDAIGSHIISTASNSSQESRQVDARYEPARSRLTAPTDKSGMVVVHDAGSGFRSKGAITDEPCPTGLSGRHNFQVDARVGSQFKRIPVDVDGPANCIQADGAQQRFDDIEPTANLRKSPSDEVLRTEWGDEPRENSLDDPAPRRSALGINGRLASKSFITARVGSGKDDIRYSTERRKLTIAELRRICSFPDDYILTGTYAQQWARLGNAVPPVMMYHIAKTVQDQVLNQITEVTGQTAQRPGVEAVA